MNIQNTQKLFLTKYDTKVLEELSDVSIHIRNNFGPNQEVIGDLMQQGLQNALVYLQRNSLGQKLSLLEENNLFTTLTELQKILNLEVVPRRIECYDISHLSGTFVYGSMVTFMDAKPAKNFYRLFRCKDRNDDFANHYEVLTRRIKRFFTFQTENPGKDNPWQLPDLIIVDGGKGQLSSDYKVLKEFELENTIALCSLAKKEEEIFVPDFDKIDNTYLKRGKEGGILLPFSVKSLVQRIRDEAHRFAITNQQNAKLKTASQSELETIPGIGPKTKQKLLLTFGSVQNLVNNLYKNPEIVYELVGKQATEKLKKHYTL